MKEVEILVHVLSSKPNVLNTLKKFNFIGRKETVDYYYYDPLRKNLTPQKKKFPKEWFRLRKKNNTHYITYKKDVFKGNVWQFSHEDETEIKDIRIAKNIIKALGLKELVVIDNIKHTFKNEKYEIVFEEVKGLGLFLEVERLKVGNQEKISVVRKEIESFIDSLGLKVNRGLSLGKPELMLKSKR